MKQYFSKKNRALLSELVRTDFKLRYQGSVLGYAWSLLKPLLLFAILYVVFVRFLRIGGDVEHFPIYLLLGIVLWNFFAEMTSQCLSSIVGRGELIRKISIPRWIIILSSSVSALINFGLNLLVVAVFMFFNDVDVRSSILLLPALVLEIYLFGLGISLILATLFVKFRDIAYIWEVILQAGFYLTPILYPLSMITNLSLQKLILLNPMAQAIQDARFVTVTRETLTSSAIFGGGSYKYIPFIIVAVVLVAGLLFFKKESKYFAENI
jgi:ABC-2 type transport system permease protein